jgi:hypothetical protein
VNYRLHPDAALEHEEQIAYYEERRDGLGRRYHLAMLRAIERAGALRAVSKSYALQICVKSRCEDFHSQSSIARFIRCCRCLRSRITGARIKPDKFARFLSDDDTAGIDERENAGESPSRNPAKFQQSGDH